LGYVSGDVVQAALFHILHPSARFADKVVMMPLVDAEKIILFAVGKEDPGNHPGFCQFIQDAIYRGKSNTAEPGLDAVPDLFGGQVGSFTTQAVHNLLPAGSNLEFQLFEYCCTLG
jgi:hypothetical protein